MRILILFYWCSMEGEQIAYKRRRGKLFYFIHCSTFTLLLIFYYWYFIKMIFFKDSLITIIILVISIWVVPVTPDYKAARGMH